MSVPLLMSMRVPRPSRPCLDDWAIPRHGRDGRGTRACHLLPISLTPRNTTSTISGVVLQPGERRIVPCGKVPRWRWAAAAHCRPERQSTPCRRSRAAATCSGETPSSVNRHAQRRAVARRMHADARNRCQPRDQRPAQFLLMPPQEPPPFEPQQRPAEAGDAVQIQRAGLVAVGAERGLFDRFRVAPRAPFHQRRQFVPRRQITRAHARRPQQALVRRAGQEVDLLPPHVDRQHAGGLRGVDQERTLGEHAAQRVEVLHRAVDVRGMLHDQQRRRCPRPCGAPRPGRSVPRDRPAASRPRCPARAPGAPAAASPRCVPSARRAPGRPASRTP